GQPVAESSDNGQRVLALAQRVEVGIHARRKRGLLPEPLYPARAAAAEVEHDAVLREPAFDDEIELVPARPPARPRRAVALAIRRLGLIGKKRRQGNRGIMR